MKWLEGVMQVRSHILCFGTGRGYMVFYEKLQDSVCKSPILLAIADYNES